MLLMQNALQRAKTQTTTTKADETTKKTNRDSNKRVAGGEVGWRGSRWSRSKRKQRSACEGKAKRQSAKRTPKCSDCDDGSAAAAAKAEGEAGEEAKAAARRQCTVGSKGSKWESSLRIILKKCHVAAYTKNDHLP